MSDLARRIRANLQEEDTLADRLKNKLATAPAAPAPTEVDALDRGDPDASPAPPAPGPRNPEFRKTTTHGLDWPIPKNFRDGVVKFRGSGIHFDPRDYGISSQLEGYADVLALNYFGALGLSQEGNIRSVELTDKLFGDVRGAFLGALMAEYRTPTDAERMEMQKTFASGLLQTAQNTALRQIQENSDKPEIVSQYQELFSKARGFQSRLNEAGVLTGILRWAGNQAELAKMNKANLARQGSLETALGSEILRFADFSEDPREGRYVVTGRSARFLPATRQDQATLDSVVDTLGATLADPSDPLSAARHVASASVAVVPQTRARLDYGIPPEAAAQLGPAEILDIRYPELSVQARAASERARVRREIAADTGNMPPGRMEAEIRKRIRNGPSKIMETALTSNAIGSPVMAELNSLAFDPLKEDQPISVAVADAVKRGMFHLGNTALATAYRAAGQGLNQLFQTVRRDNAATFHDPDGRLRRYADLTVDELRDLSPEQQEALAESPTGPATFALRRDLAAGRMTYGTLMAVMNPDNDDLVALSFLEADRYFPIAEDLVKRWGAANFTLETMQEEWRIQKRALKGELNQEGFGSDKDVEKKLGEYSLAVRKMNPLSPTSEGLFGFLNPLRVTSTGTKALRWAAAQAKNLHHRVTTYAEENPSKFQASVITDLIVGDLALPALANPAGQAVRAGYNSFQAARKARRVADLGATVATHSAPAVRRMQEALRQIRRPNTPEGYAAVLQQAEDALDTLDKLHQRDRTALLKNRQAAPDLKTANKAQTDLRRALSDFNQTDIREYMDSVGMIDDYLSPTHLAGRMPLIPEVGRLLGEATQIRGTPAAPRTLLQSDDIWRNIKRATEDGTLDQLKREDAVNLLSLRASSQVRGAGREFVRRLKESIFNRHGDRAVLSDDGFVNDVVDFFGPAQERLHAFRQFAGEKRAAAREFLDHVRRSRLRQSADTGIDYSEAIAAVDNAASQSANVHFSLPVQFGRHPVIAHIGLDDVISWTATHDGAGNTLFRRMAKAGEGRDEFYTRLAEMAPEDEAQFLQVFAREYLNAPSIRRRFAIDPYSGEAITGRQSTKLRRERQAFLTLDERIGRLRQRLGRERGTDAAAVTEGKIERLVRQKQVLEQAQDRGTQEFLRALRNDPEFEWRRSQWESADLDWDLVEGYAAGADAVDMTETLIRYQDMTNHDPLAHLGAVKALHVENAMKIGGLKRQNELLHAAYEAADPRVHKAFDAALTAQEQAGDFLPLIQLRKKHPELFRSLPQSLDDSLQHLLDTSKELRWALIEELEDVGWFRNAEEAARWKAPWTSQQWRQLVDDEYLDVTIKTAPGARGTKRGLTNNEFQTRREKAEWKLVVSRRNSATEELAFPTQTAAREYLERNFGVQSGKFRPDADVDGKTATGDAFSVLAPLGDNFLNFVDELPAGPSTLRRLTSLVKQVAVARTSKSLDLPGLRLTRAEAARIRGTPAGEGLLRQYVQIGEDNRKFGRLRGKLVHRKALTTIEDSDFAAELMEEMGDALRESAQFHERFFESALGTALKQSFAVPVRAIGANAIFRRLRTWQKNFLNNQALFGPLAVGGHHKYWFGRGARKGHDIATKIVYGSPEDINKLIAESPLAREIFEMNALDDTLGHGLVKNASHRVMRRIVFGDDPSDKLNTITGLKENLLGLAGRRGGEGAIRSMADLWEKVNPASASPALRAVERELMEIDAKTAAGDFAALPENVKQRLVDRRAALIKKLNQSRGVMGALIRFSDYAGLMIQGRNFRKAGLGRFSDNGSIAAELYGSLDNYGRIKAYIINRLENGNSARQALDRTNRYMQRYGYGYLRNVPKFARGPLGSPAISFPLEMARITKNVVMDNPGFFLGLWNALPLLNSVSLAASGDDPAYVAEMFRNESGGFGAQGTFQTGLVVPTGYGNYSYHQMEIMDPANHVRHPFSDKTEPTGALDVMNRAVSNFFSRLVGGNPVAKAVIFGSQGRDSRTGIRETGKSRLKQTWDNLTKDALPYMVNPYTPLLGKFSTDIARPAPKAALIRFRSAGERLLEELSGIAPKGLPAAVEKGLEPFVRATQLLTGDVKGLGRQYVAGGAFNEDDYLRAQILMSRGQDVESAGLWEYSVDEDFKELQALNGVGDTEGAQRVVERIAAKQTLQSVGKTNVMRQITEEEFVQAHKKAFDNQTIDDVIKALPIARKMTILIAAVGDGAPDYVLRRIVALSQMRESGRLYQGTSPTQFARTEQLVTQWLKTAPTGPGREAVEGLWGFFQIGRAKAEVDFAIENATDEARAAALEAFQEANGGLRANDG